MSDTPHRISRPELVGVVLPAWLALMATLWLNHLDRQATIKAEVLHQRRDALVEALEVVDLVHANVQFEGMPAITGKEWDITKARDAANKILIYSAKPEQTLRSFYRAIGLHEPLLGQKPPAIKTEYLNEFRNEVARELELPTIDYLHFRAPWIYSLSGAK